jgi:hypothetical protein
MFTVYIDYFFLFTGHIHTDVLCKLVLDALVQLLSEHVNNLVVIATTRSVGGEGQIQ